MLQIVASLIDAARGVIYDRHMFIVQATDWVKNSHLAYFRLLLTKPILALTSSFHTWFVVGFFRLQIWFGVNVLDFQIQL